MKKYSEKSLSNEAQIENVEDVRSLSYYIPNRVIRFLASEECSVFDHKIENLEGFVVYLDIMGFTKIVIGNLNKNNDITTVSNTLSEFYSVLIEIVQGYGGSVFQFAGDSILISFDKHNGESTINNFKRTLCAATAMLDISDNFNSLHDEDFNLRPKVGIGYGKFYQYFMGSQKSFITAILTGTAVHDAISCESQCKKQEIIVSEPVYQFAKELGIENSFENIDGFYHITQKIDTNSFEVNIPDFVSIDEMNENPMFAERVCAFIDPVIMQNAKSRIQGFSGDYKEITCLMAHFDITEKINDDPETVKAFFEQINGINTIMQSKSQRYNAYCTKPDISDKGIVFLVFFGTPNVIENKERSAMLCAQEIISSSKKSSFITSANIGITTGLVYSGEFGSYMRKEYTAIGNSINLASRFMMSAVGKSNYSIVMDNATTNAVADYIKIEKIPGIECKGYEKAQEANYLLGINYDVIDGSKTKLMIGRDKELSKLMSLLETSIGNQINFAFVTGEAGIGKSILANKFADAVEQKYKNAHILRGKMYQHESKTAFFCWRFIIRQLMDIPDDFFDTMIPDIVEAYFKENLPEDIIWESFLLNMLGLNIKEEQETANIDVTKKQQIFFSLVLRLLNSAARTTPLIIIVDDVQWCDEVSYKLIQFLLETRTLKNVFCVFIARDSVLLNSFFKSRNVFTLTLKPLSNENSLMLTKSLLNLDKSNEELENRIATTSGGNPLFIENIVQNFIDNGILVKNKKGKNELHTSADGIKSISIPSSIKNIILSKLTSLSVEEQIMCKTASVVGKSFTADILPALYSDNISLEKTISMLKEIEKHGIIDYEKRTKKYTFKSITIHDVIYSTILGYTKRELNRKIISYLEEKYKNNASDYAERLLYHAKEVRDFKRIFEYSTMAAKKAEKTFAVKDAIHFYLIAIEALNQLPEENSSDKYKIELQLSEAYRANGDYDRLYDVLNAIIENCKDEQILAQAHQSLERYYQERGKIETATQKPEKKSKSSGKKNSKKGNGKSQK